MPQATGRAQSRARAGRSGGATGAVRRAGACISARIPLVGASSERRVIAALFLLPEYRRFTANRVARWPQIVLTNRRRQDRKSVVEGKSVSVRVNLGGRRKK